MFMDIYRRRVYVVRVLIAAAIGFVLVFLISWLTYEEFVESHNLLIEENRAWFEATDIEPSYMTATQANKISHSLMFSVMGIWGLGGICGGVTLTIWFISEKDKTFRIICTVFFIFTIWIAAVIGIIFGTPYWVYNVVKLIQHRRGKKSSTPMHMDGQLEAPPRGKVSISPMNLFPAIRWVCTAACGGGILAMLALENLEMNPTVPFGLSAVLIIICTRVCTAWASRKLKRIRGILNDDCDPDSYIRAVADLLGQQNGPGTQYYCKLLLSTGYLMAGNISAAEATLKGVRLDVEYRPKAQQHYNAITAHLNYCDCALQRGDGQAAQLALERATDSLNSLADNAQYRESIESSCADMQYRLRMFQGDYSDAQAHYQVRFDTAASHRERVATKYHFGVAALGCGDQLAAAGAFTYVIQHGGGLYYVTQAQRVPDIL